MANYSVTKFVTTGTAEAVVAALETQIETVDNGKTIRVFDIYHRGGNDFVGVLVYDT